MNKYFILILLFFVKVTFSQLQNTNDVIEKLKLDSVLQHASWGICIIDNSNGNILVDKDKSVSLVPASSTKTITTSSALALLGEDYTYKTQVYYEGQIVNHTLKGNLFIQGSGDPTIGSSKMEQSISEETFISNIIGVLKKFEIQKIEGSVLVDASCFNGFPTPITWNWSDIGNNYGAGSFGFNSRDNEFVIQCNPTKKNQAPEIEVSPVIPSLHIINEFYCTDTVNNGDDAYVFGAAYDNNRLLNGPVPLNAAIKVKGSMPDPPFYFASLLTEKLAASGIEVTGFPATDRTLQHMDALRSEEKNSLYTYVSPPLKDIITATNQMSLNLYAESLLKTISKEINGVATAADGLQLIVQYWKSKGVDLDGFYMKDGSGLSRHNAISPYHFAQILYAISKENYFSTFKKSLAVAGESGTLKSLCVGTNAAGKIIAKSGTVERGISYTGYVQSSSGKQLTFCMIFNNYTCTNAILRKKIEQLMVAMSKI
ncbi:MAG: D-alanyl-D-alanine carboxypeptidase/D-alanyl-D-alanine-endopeptidase [Bacteroidota bacterium]